MKRYYFFFKEGSKINQIICAVLINLPVLGYGASIGWMSPMTLLLQSDESPVGRKLSDNVVSWMASSPYISCIIFAFIFAYLGDVCGRKLSLLFMSSIFVACWVLLLSSMEDWAFITARTIVGMGMAAAVVTCPIYTKEISEDSIRGALGSLVILSQTTGNLLLYIVGDVLSYRMILWFCLAIPTLHLVLFLMMPESPSYLVKMGRLEEATRVVAWLRCRQEDDSIVLKELEVLKKEQMKDDEGSKFALKSILSDRILLKAFGIAMMLTLAREVCGANPVLTFAGYIFDMASKGTGLMLSPNQQAMLLGAVQVTGSALASSIVENTGRKPLLFTTSLISGVSMCGLATWFLAKTYNFYAPDWLPITTLCLCIFCDAAGLQPISVVVMNEIFSFKYRSTVSSITMSTASAADFFQLLFFKPLASSVGVHVCFYFFGAVCILNAIYVILFVPETKMRTVEEIYEKLGGKKGKDVQSGVVDIKDDSF